MAAGAQAREWDRPSRRRVQRFPMQQPLDVTVLRSGIPDTVPGRAVNVCERGVGVVLAGELIPGETVAVELQLSRMTQPLLTRATVRYHDRLRCGLEFVTISTEQRVAIRNWTIENNAQAEVEPETPKQPVVTSQAPPVAAKIEKALGLPARIADKPRKKRRRVRWIITFAVLMVAAALLWWKWNHDWREIESGLATSETVASARPQVQVAADVMQQLLVHKVEPVYPAEARKENLTGIIALDVVVGRDGSVESVRALNGPDVLARAATDALRWWRFEPYRVNGEPAVVQTTVAVEFKK
jgi:TonB family protein